MKNRTKPSSANASDMAAHELTLHLGLAGSRDAKTVGGDTDADTRANGRQAVTDDLQCCEYKRDFHNFLLFPTPFLLWGI